MTVLPFYSKKDKVKFKFKDFYCKICDDFFLILCINFELNYKIRYFMYDPETNLIIYNDILAI